MDRRIIIVVAAVAVVAAAVYIGFLRSGGRTRTITGVVQKYEFTELVPPSTLVPPGTLITVIKESPLIVGVICPPSESLGAGLQTKLLTSDSTSSKEVAELTGEFKVDASVQQQIISNNNSKYVKDISVVLSNVKIIEIPDSVVFELVSGRKDSCSKAMQFRREKGEKI